MKHITAGYGDEATWPDYDGNPNDPRHDEEQEEYEYELLEDTDTLLHWLKQFGDHCDLFDVFASDNVKDILRARNSLRAKYIAWRLK